MTTTASLHGGRFHAWSPDTGIYWETVRDALKPLHNHIKDDYVRLHIVSCIYLLLVVLWKFKKNYIYLLINCKLDTRSRTLLVRLPRADQLCTVLIHHTCTTTSILVHVHTDHRSGGTVPYQTGRKIAACMCMQRLLVLGRAAAEREKKWIHSFTPYVYDARRTYLRTLRFRYVQICGPKSFYLLPVSIIEDIFFTGSLYRDVALASLYDYTL